MAAAIWFFFYFIMIFWTNSHQQWSLSGTIWLLVVYITYTTTAWAFRQTQFIVNQHRKSCVRSSWRAVVVWIFGRRFEYLRAGRSQGCRYMLEGLILFTNTKMKCLIFRLTGFLFAIANRFIYLGGQMLHIYLHFFFLNVLEKYRLIFVQVLCRTIQTFIDILFNKKKQIKHASVWVCLSWYADTYVLVRNIYI